ncbi:restriction endonuclease subunit S [Nocardioides sp. WL0053]|uniref:Restriction endonuclease subunit S n=1 Tax=Nocardioides jiangsuensis TaxID=2866161 RepID=A0ABS7RGQ1_9ACTN|nr:restriction endonuclease subunit S [Nocardioides jiangsuensis]MBY9074222.1 restriction endonuclease subunit S [Nocardioides jiangsuensis]
MDAQDLLEKFGTVAEAPGGIQGLRSLVLDLAIDGQLVPQDPADEPADLLVERLVQSRKTAQDALRIRGHVSTTRAARPKTATRVPEGWTEVVLGETFLVVMGNSPPGDSYNRTGEGVPLINGPVEFSAEPLGRTLTSQFTTAPTRMCLEGDLLVCVRGATTGRTNIAGSNACIGRGVALVRGWEAQDFINIVMWNLGSQLLAAGKGTTFPSISYDDLANLPVKIPPQPEQERIVARVDELLELCDRLEAAQKRRGHATAQFRASGLDALTAARTADDLQRTWGQVSMRWPVITEQRESAADVHQAILELALRGRLAGQDSGDSPASALLPGKRRHPVVEPYPIPAGWTWARFDEVAESRLGKMLDKAKNTGPARPYLRNANVRWFGFDISDVYELRLEDRDLDAYTVREGDLVICEGGEPGRAAVCDASVEGMVIQKALHRARPRPGINAWYLAYMLRCYATSGFLASFFTGATIKHLTGRSLGAVPVPLPPASEQLRIVTVVDELGAKCNDLERAVLRSDRAHMGIGLGASRLSDLRGGDRPADT